MGGGRTKTGIGGRKLESGAAKGVTVLMILAGIYTVSFGVARDEGYEQQKYSVLGKLSNRKSNETWELFQSGHDPPSGTKLTLPNPTRFEIHSSQPPQRLPVYRDCRRATDKDM